MAASLSISSNPSFTSSSKISHPLSPLPHCINFPAITTQIPIKSLNLRPPRAFSAIPRAATSQPPSSSSDRSVTFYGVCYVVGDNIDTDQIIPAEYLTLVPTNPAEREKLGSHALCGLASSSSGPFVEPGETKSKYSIVIGGENFGCGSSREHAPVALDAAGTAAVVAESYARSFFRNSVSTAEVYPLKSEVRICEECRTGDVITIELGESRLINHTTGKEYKLKPIGDAGPVIEAGGIFAYARKTGIIPPPTA